MSSVLDGPVLEGRGLGKVYGPVTALDTVDVAFGGGRVHALLGENGAGKSTLVGILTGQHPPDSGQVLLDGKPAWFADPRDAMAAGVTAVHQELTVLPAMSVADNVMLGQELAGAGVRRGVLRRNAQRARVRESLDRVGLSGVDPNIPAGELSLANQQLVEIARALVRRSRVIVLDEPSAVLSGDKLEGLHAVVRELVAAGTAVVYITHLLDEVATLADDVTVLRDGRLVSTGPATDYPLDRIVSEMVGRTVDSVFPQRPEPADRVVLRVRGLVPRGSTPAEPVDLEVRAGEILGVAGLVGSGRSRLLRTLAGAHPRARGEVKVDGRSVGMSLTAAMNAGIVLVPEERKIEGLVLDLSGAANTTLTRLADTAAFGWRSARAERAAFAEEAQRLRIRAVGPEQLVRELSGGNQQKIAIARCLRCAPAVLLLDEPTRGVDIGAKTEIYRIVVELAAAGLAVVLVSSELPEVLGLAHRVLVCRGGTVVGELRGAEMDEENVMHVAVGSGRL
jgi:ABC-type sugar transport system ATPase subunit